MDNYKQKTIIIIVCLASLLFFAGQHLIFAGKENEKPVLIIDKEEIDPALYYIQGQEVLIAARVFSRTLDTKVRWFGPIKTLQIEKEDLKVKMMVDSTLVQVDKQVEQLAVAPKIIDNQMFVPLIYLSSKLGYLCKREDRGIRIYKPSIKIEGFSVLKPGREFRIDFNKKPELKQFFLAEPARIVLDIPDALLEEDLQDRYFAKGLVKEVRFSQFQPDVVRAVFQLRTDNNYLIKKETKISGYSLQLTFPPEIEQVVWGETGLVITANDLIEDYAVTYLEEPARLVIDMPEVVINNPQELIGEGAVQQVRSSQFSWDPVVARIVLDLEKKIPFKADRSADGKELTFAPQFTRASLRKVEPYPPEKGNGFKVTLDEEVTPQFFILQDPLRLVMDLPGTANEFPLQELEVGGDIVKRLRIAQFDEQTSRIVADLNNLAGYDWTYLNDEKNQLVVNFANQITGMALEEKDNLLKFSVQIRGHPEYKVSRLTEPDRLVIDMYGINIEDDIAIPERGSFINDIRVSQFSRDPLVARAVLELPFYPGHSVKYREENNSLDLTIPTSRLGGRVVVIDPGHGGVDPGAIGTNGLLEKDVNLAVAEELRRLLIQAGTRVYMTREDDSYPSFPRRVGLANDREADIFVSIHCNSFTEDIPEGTETYVARSSNGNSHLLAELVQSELAGELRLLDRGVKPANFYVLLNTKMPAILVELAFISNPQEEALLKKAQFLDSAAAAIYRGINRYFSRQQ